MLSAPGRSSAPAVGNAAGGESEPRRGDTIGRFVVLGVLGAGGMGLVYSAYDPHLDRKVAIKLLRPEAARSTTLEASTRRLGKAKDAAELDQRLIDVAKKAYGPDHPRIAMLWMNLGHAYEDLERPADAITAYEQSLALFEAKLGKDHVYVSYPLL